MGQNLRHLLRSGPSGQKSVFLLWFISGALPLAAALFFEHWMGIVPCKMCIYERIPYACVLVVALLAFVRPNWGAFLKVFVMLFYSAGVIISLYHVGIEYGFVEGLQGCTGDVTFAGSTPTELENFLNNAPARRCDQIYKVFDLVSFSILNAGYALIMAFFVSMTAVQRRRLSFR